MDDSERKPGEARRGYHYADPRDYDVLLCTSSVEVGVTFHSTLMFMEPGHDLASFVQRIGRVSRGKDDGQVIVSLSKDRRNRHTWIRHIATIIESDEELSPQTVTDKILRDARNRICPTRKEAEADFASDGSTVPFYRRASWRGALRRSDCSLKKIIRSKHFHLMGATHAVHHARVQRGLALHQTEKRTDNVPRGLGIVPDAIDFERRFVIERKGGAGAREAEGFAATVGCDPQKKIAY